MFENTCLKLSTYLYSKQNTETPLTLNALLSAWLL